VFQEATRLEAATGLLVWALLRCKNSFVLRPVDYLLGFLG
jgi:hypothetical protein